MYGRWASDVVGGEKEDAVALAAFSEVDGTCALVVRCLERGDLDAKRGSEGATKLGTGSIEGSKERSFGSTDRVTMDSRNATSTSGNPSRAYPCSPWLPITPIQR